MNESFIEKENFKRIKKVCKKENEICTKAVTVLNRVFTVIAM
jgi:hypothetical protein